jgi:hypothetical protein
MLTPQKIQDLSDPIESVYIAMTNELLVNIGRHITSPTWTHTAAWEIQKLSELGQLTQENAAIINRWIKSLPQEIRDTMEETRRVALEGIEKQMERAARDGYLTPPERDSTVQVLQEYSQQAADQLNLVNTTMLQSSLQQYSRMVQLTAEIERQAEQTQTILNEAAGSVASGVETRTQALHRAIRRISEEGLTGFYDRAGRSWSPEAYVNMDIRTTVHNVAIQSIKNRMGDYNAQVFQVSAHAGARPLCYPFQGKLYSWDNTAGEIELGNGKTMRYEPLNSTSYGEPAGLFGINCGHSPIPIIPGVSIPHAQDFVQPKEENDKQYAESQQQRALERKIRAAKRAVEMGDDSQEAKARVKAAQEQMRQFIKETGRTRRPDRESLYGGKKAPTPPKDQRPENENVKSKLTTPKLEPVKVEFGQALKKSLAGTDLQEYTETVEKAGQVVANLYTKYSDGLNKVDRVNGGGVFRGAWKSIEWDYAAHSEMPKYETLAHEFGHFIDVTIPQDRYTTKEIDYINAKANENRVYKFPVIKTAASTSDLFLTAMRADRDRNKGFISDATINKQMREDLVENGRRNITANIQDAFDGFWSTQDARPGSPIRLPWGHGDKYYNRAYSSAVKGNGVEKEVKQALLDLGFDASNQTKVKRIMRDYETASELWANIQSAETVGGETLECMRKYFPEACKAWETIAGSVLDGQ